MFLTLLLTLSAYAISLAPSSLISVSFKSISVKFLFSSNALAITLHPRSVSLFSERLSYLNPVIQSLII
jgi:hypothetical protein